MKTLFLMFCVLISCTLNSNGQSKKGKISGIDLSETTWKFKTGDNKMFSETLFDDKNWETIKVNASWESQGHEGYDGIAWYRYRFNLPSSLKKSSFLKDSIAIVLGKIDDQDITFLNGNKIGENGFTVNNKNLQNENTSGSYSRNRKYILAVNDPVLKWDSENVIAIRVKDTGGDGGLYTGQYVVKMIDITDNLLFSTGTEPFHFSGKKVSKQLDLINEGNIPLNGILKIRISTEGNNKTIAIKNTPVKLAAHSSYPFTISAPGAENTIARFSFAEDRAPFPISGELRIPYILTPEPGAFPKINGAAIVGVRPGADFLFSIPASGSKPMTYSASKLPDGIQLDVKTGILNGNCKKEGNYSVNISAKNNVGLATRKLKIVVGSKIGLSPAMGWNSWNAFGLSVNTEKVKEAVDAMESKGLKDHGYTYINIDDGWEDSTRDLNGNIKSNKKFSNMNELTDYIHSHGLKAGIYSSPGPQTCGGFLGSWKHENQDAKTWAKWGFDYIKYDWCSYGNIDTAHNKTRENYMRPYITMQKAIASTGRDIYYSLCQYGMGDVWKWGAEVNANSWRTTGDINDTWGSLYSIGFSQDKISAYAKPGGGWNDPDMLIVGNVGWGPSLHPTRLTPDEQYTHISLWSLLAAPLLIGCDMAKLDPFTINLISNDEVIAIDQDIEGKQAMRILNKPEYQVWIKELSGGRKAIGIFNLENQVKAIHLDWKEMGIKKGRTLRDVWRQINAGNTESNYSAEIPPHGVRLLIVN